MLGRIRIYDLARELGLPAKAALEELRTLGISAKSHSNTIDQTDADRLRRKVASGAPAKPKKGKTKAQKAKTSPGKPAKVVRAGKPKTSPAKSGVKSKKVSAPKAKAQVPSISPSGPMSLRSLIPALNPSPICRRPPIASSATRPWPAKT